MADIPNRNTVFPTWAAIKENLETGVVKVESPKGSLAQIKAMHIDGVPTNTNSSTMDLININVPADLWDTYDTVVVNGNGYPELVNTSVPAGGSLTINGGQRWLKTSLVDGVKNFKTELPDDEFFVHLEPGATLKLRADQTAGRVKTVDLQDPTTGELKQFALGGKNVAVVSGSGIFTADMGDYASNLFVTAEKANVKMGKGNGVDGENYYLATGNSAGHNVIGGKKADTFEYNFEGQNRAVGANKFDGKPGSTEPFSETIPNSGTDNMQLRNIPAGSKVEVKVNAINGGGTFPDADMSITIKKPDGTELGKIDAKDVNYLFLLNSATQFISPKDIGVGGNRTYTVGQ